MAVRNELIHCELCGEDYSSVYRRCPFCEGRGGSDWSQPGARDLEDDELDFGETGTRVERRTSRRSGGRHLAGRRGGGYGRRRVLRTILFLLSLALIIAAAWIIITTILPRLLPKDPTPPDSQSPATSGSPSPVETLAPNPTDSLPVDSDPAPTASDPAPTESEPVDTQPAVTTTAAAGLRLNRADFTLDTQYPTFRITASGASGTVSWSSNDPSVATVSENGTVTAVGPGSCTVTATDQAGSTAKCIVRVAAGFGGGAAPSPSPEPSPSPSPEPSQTTGSARLSHSDVSLSSVYGMGFQLSVSGGTAASYASGNTSVATVSESGIVRGVGTGTTTITVTLTDGTVLKCIVRVSV